MFLSLRNPFYQPIQLQRKGSNTASIRSTKNAMWLWRIDRSNDGLVVFRNYLSWNNLTFDCIDHSYDLDYLTPDCDQGALQCIGLYSSLITTMSERNFILTTDAQLNAPLWPRLLRIKQISANFLACVCVQAARRLKLLEYTIDMFIEFIFIHLLCSIAVGFCITTMRRSLRMLRLTPITRLVRK